DAITAQGYKVVSVGTGEEAVAEVGKRHFDLIFLDLVLPGITGVEALSRIKGKDKKAVVTIITGYGDDPIALEAMSLGPLFLIRKPFRIEDIVEVLSILVKGRR
ncbi:MAG: response regulator, partial [Dehalococcoidia bacterium]